MDGSLTKWLGCFLCIALHIWFFWVSCRPRPISQTQVHSTRTNILFDCDTTPIPLSRLEFVHVPKTGGSFVEILAAQHNVSWGACHYQRQIQDTKCPWSLPKLKAKNTWTHASEWHTPLGIRDELPQWADNASLFMVVRNPYDRLVSEWNYVSQWNKNQPCKQDLLNVAYMNSWIQDHLRMVWENPPRGTYNLSQRSPVASTYYQLDSHLIPQADYWVPGILVLRAETLYEDLTCLLQPLGWEIPSKKVNPSSGKLTTANLTRTTRRWIERVYARDFRMLGYERYQDGWCKREALESTTRESESPTMWHC